MTHPPDGRLAGAGGAARAAGAAIHAGATEYIPVRPERAVIAAGGAAVANDSREMIYRDESMAK
ncbi:hypothetical protein P3G22_22580, partial [Rhodopseudomonas sp. BAL398]|nr:hypothetical protein [Rhodopseudomonas sp. BAL398]